MNKIDTNEDAGKGMAEITSKIEELRKKLKEQKALADEEEKKLQSIVDESRDALVSSLFSTFLYLYYIACHIHYLLSVLGKTPSS